MSRGPFSLRRQDHWEVAFWLAFDITGGVRLTRSQPSLDRDERGMSVTVKVPHALFSTPQLRATIAIDAPTAPAMVIDATAAAEALRQAIGCDIDLTIHHPETGP